MADGGREGDWDCGECRNRNYAFRSFCNRCKQPRLFVDTKTPADSKWLPRIGDWICAGCSNNNYASREKCKKCGQSKEEAAMPAIPISMASFQNYGHFLARMQGLHGSKATLVPNVNPSFETLPFTANWPYAEFDKYRLPSTFSEPLNGSNMYLNNTNQLSPGPKGWRSGDWMCNCGFHNYSSRTECKKCNAPVTSVGSSAASSTVSDMFPTLGTKRLASEEFAADWDNKRLNTRDSGSLDFEQQARLGSIYPSGYSQYLGGNSASTSMALTSQSPQKRLVPTLLGKGANQWRDGDWMCSNCNNHNYASRSFCNRCKTQKEAAALPVSVA